MEKDRKKLYQKWLLLFFIVMAVCTVVSRIADSMTIPKVIVEKSEKGRIAYNLKGSGTIQATVKKTYLIPAGFLVEFCQEDGTSVEAGEVLIRFQKEQLEKRKQVLKTELEQAELQLEQAKLNQNQDAWIPEEEKAQRALDKAQAEYNQAEEAKQHIQEVYDQKLRQLDQEKEDACQKADQEREKTGEEGYQQTIEEVESEFSQRKAELDAKLTDAESRLSEAVQGLSNAQEGLETAQKSDAVTRQNAKKSQQSASYTVKRAQLAVETAEINLQETEELLIKEGKILAEENGTFLNTAVLEGAITTGSEFISIGTGKFEFTAEVPQKAREKIAEGDSVSIKIPGKDTLEVPITQIASKKGEEDTIVLKAELPEELNASGDYATFSIKKESEEYQNILPLTAIRQDSRGYYCLGIRTKESILGEELKAERINITLIDKDDTQAAVEGAIRPDTKIIVTSEKDVLANDRVRLDE